MFQTWISTATFPGNLEVISWIFSAGVTWTAPWSTTYNFKKQKFFCQLPHYVKVHKTCSTIIILLWYFSTVFRIVTFVIQNEKLDVLV